MAIDVHGQTVTADEATGEDRQVVGARYELVALPEAKAARARVASRAALLRAALDAPAA